MKCSLNELTNNNQVNQFAVEVDFPPKATVMVGAWYVSLVVFDEAGNYERARRFISNHAAPDDTLKITPGVKVLIETAGCPLLAENHGAGPDTLVFDKGCKCSHSSSQICGNGKLLAEHALRDEQNEVWQWNASQIVVSWFGVFSDHASEPFLLPIAEKKRQGPTTACDAPAEPTRGAGEYIIQSISTATPVAVFTTVEDHGLKTGDAVYITGVTGTSGDKINGRHVVTYLDKKQFKVEEYDEIKIPKVLMCCKVVGSAAGGVVQKVANAQPDFSNPAYEYDDDDRAPKAVLNGNAKDIEGLDLNSGMFDGVPNIDGIVAYRWGYRELSDEDEGTFVETGNELPADSKITFSPIANVQPSDIKRRPISSNVVEVNCYDANIATIRAYEGFINADASKKMTYEECNSAAYGEMTKESNPVQSYFFGLVDPTPNTTPDDAIERSGTCVLFNQIPKCMKADKAKFEPVEKSYCKTKDHEGRYMGAASRLMVYKTIAPTQAHPSWTHLPPWHVVSDLAGSALLKNGATYMVGIEATSAFGATKIVTTKFSVDTTPPNLWDFRMVCLQRTEAEHRQRGRYSADTLPQAGLTILQQTRLREAPQMKQP